MELAFFTGKIRNMEELSHLLGQDSVSQEKELIESGYRILGEAFFSKINGSFSFVLKDANTLICVRDRFGAASLYYSILEDGSVIYSDSIRDILKDGRVRKEFRRDLLEIYLSFSFLPGEESFFANISKVMPGYICRIENGQLTKKRFFTPHFAEKRNCSKEEMADDLFHVLAKVIAQQPPVGASLLSSGVDSSLLAVWCKVKDTYTAKYDYSSFCEVDLARKLSEEIGAKHHCLPVTPELFLKSTADTMYLLEQPSGDASAVVLYLACKGISCKYTDCLSGEGIDELFLGYHLEEAQNIAEGQSLKEMSYIGCTNIMTEDEKREILLESCGTGKMDLCREAYELTKENAPLCQAAMLDLLLWFEGNLLRNLEKLGAKFGLNLVTPYLDNRLYDIALTIPCEMQHDQQMTKRIFRMAAERILGHEIAFRSKRGFPVPIRLWMRSEEFQSALKETFCSAAAAQFFNRDKLMAMYDAYISDEEDFWHWRSLWNIYCFILWYRICVEGEESLISD